MEKSEIRKKIKAMKAMMLENEKLEAAEKVFEILEQSAAFMLAEKILMYHSLPDELPTRGFLNKWSSRKKFYLPRVNGVNLEILPYNESRLELGSFHIEEPTGNDVVDPDEIELIVVPGVAYDEYGNRLGRGKGFYDRLLSSSSATKVGVGFDFQIVESIPSEPHDVAMDIVISPTRYRILRKVKSRKR
ncbi:MAG: 5-formyltetrahydrofolate cyclo-ligase [Bacteroidales bacterium]|nr:5-formyltetrahydrofolate cyclo-ligase [Bacteroidales bacterium]MBD5206386.1 5-formyltetrahydrofolate cyclo-ligase [Bacteroidales bacterium]MBD5224307.1 5-formyltetrahydrofolate cyclo-ligase [Bacteroidales bacterium]